MATERSSTTCRRSICRLSLALCLQRRSGLNGSTYAGNRFDGHVGVDVRRAERFGARVRVAGAGKGRRCKLRFEWCEERRDFAKAAPRAPVHLRARWFKDNDKTIQSKAYNPPSRHRPRLSIRRHREGTTPRLLSFSRTVPRSYLPETPPSGARIPDLTRPHVPGHNEQPMPGIILSPASSVGAIAGMKRALPADTAPAHGQAHPKKRKVLHQLRHTQPVQHIIDPISTELGDFGDNKDFFDQQLRRAIAIQCRGTGFAGARPDALEEFRGLVDSCMACSTAP